MVEDITPSKKINTKAWRFDFFYYLCRKYCNMRLKAAK